MYKIQTDPFTKFYHHTVRVKKSYHRWGLFRILKLILPQTDFSVPVFEMTRPNTVPPVPQLGEWLKVMTNAFQIHVRGWSWSINYNWNIDQRDGCQHNPPEDFDYHFFQLSNLIVWVQIIDACRIECQKHLNTFIYST